MPDTESPTIQRGNPENLPAGALDATPVCILLIRSGILTFAGGRLAEELGLLNLVGREVNEALAGVGSAGELVTSALEGKTAAATVPFRNRWLDIKAIPFSGDVLILVTDATEKAEVRQRLLLVGERQRLFREAGLEGVLLHDHGTILDTNEAVTALFGFTFSEMVGRSVLDFLSVDASERELLLTDDAPHETIGVRKDGLTFPVEIQGKTISYGGHQVRVAALRSIIERKRAETALRESEIRYRELFENASDFVYTHDLAGQITSLNRAAESMVGYLRSEVVGLGIADIISPEHLPLAREMMLRKLAGENIPAYEIDIVSKEGRRVTLEVSTRLILNDGAPMGVQGVGRDVTERKRMEEELRNRARFDELIMGISTHFISLAPDEIDAAIVEALGLVGDFVGVDRSYIFMFDDKGMHKTHEWCASGVLSQPQAIEARSFDYFPWLSAKLKRREIIHISRVADLPAEAAVEKKLYASQQVQTLLSIPMISGRTHIGLLGLDSVKCEKVWTDNVVAMVKIVAEVLVNAIERKRAEEALRESEERYKLAAMGANDGLWDWTVKTGVVYYSLRWKSMLGLDESEVGVSLDDWLSRVHPDDAPTLRSDLESHLGGIAAHFENEHRIMHKDGTLRWVLSRAIAVRDAEGNATRVAGSLTDITVRKAAEERLFFDAFHDSLTGLPNRALFLDRLDRSIRRSIRNEDYKFAVLFLDLDRFKVVNDGLGHSQGDQFLIAIARRLEDCLRPGDTIARMGGDEFTFLIDDIKTLTDATRVAERIQAELTKPFVLLDTEVFSSASIGIAIGGAAYERPEDLLRDADTAMYRAKSLGKSRYAIFDAPMHARAMEQLDLETELRRAVEREDFSVLYQPIIELTSGLITGFEALLRWKHPKRGMMVTPHFIPLAEETGLIVPIGKWVLREACKQSRIWQDLFPRNVPLTMAVNFSARQFMQPKLANQIQATIDETGIDPRSLHLEITESVLMENADTATSVVSQLKVMNLKLSIDDFGTGYSSLSYLHRFPIDSLKIDRSFISRMGTSDETAIVRTITALAHHLNKTVIAEGVETAEQLELLRQLKCEKAQGFLFAKPLSASDAEAMLRTNPRW